MLCWLIIEKLAFLGPDIDYWLQTDNFVEHGIWHALWLAILGFFGDGFHRVHGRFFLAVFCELSFDLRVVFLVESIEFVFHSSVEGLLFT